MDQTSITAAGAIDTFLVLFIGIEPKLALVPFVEITALLDAATSGGWSATCWSPRVRWR